MDNYKASIKQWAWKGYMANLKTMLKLFFQKAQNLSKEDNVVRGSLT